MRIEKGNASFRKQNGVMMGNRGKIFFCSNIPDSTFTDIPYNLRHGVNPTEPVGDSHLTSPAPVRILLVETDTTLTTPVHNILLARQLIPSFDFTAVKSLAAAFQEIDRCRFELIVMDLDPKEDPSMSSLARMREVDAQTPVIALLADRNGSRALDVLHKGAQGYLLKSQLNPETLPTFLWRAVERHAHDQAIRQSEERFRTMIEHASDVILMLDAGGVVTFASPSTASILKVAPHDLTGRNALDYFHRDDRREFLSHLDKAFDSGEPIPFVQLRFRLKEGGWLPLEGKGRIVDGEKGKRCVLNCHDVSHRVKLEDELRTLSLRDELTGLHNRRSFVTFIDQQIKLAHRTGRRGLCLLMLDLDGFKQINDTLGHKEGDRALIDAARILQTTFRDADIIARLGGDEFVVFLTDSIGNAQLEIVKRRLFDGVESWNQKEHRRYRLAMSVGAVHHDPAVHRTPEDLLLHADELMYQQKRERKRLALGAAGAPTAGHAHIEVEAVSGSAN